MKVVDSDFEKMKKEKEAAKAATITAKDVLKEALEDAEDYSDAVVILANPVEGYSTLYTHSTPAQSNIILDVAKMNILGEVTMTNEGEDE